MVGFQRAGDPPVVASQAIHDGGASFVATAVLGDVLLKLNDWAVDIAAGDDVDHAGHRVGAVDGGRAVLQDLDAVDHDVRQHVQVGGTNGTARTGWRHAPAVQQQQGTGGAQAAQRQSVDTAAAVDHVAAVRVVDLRGACGDGVALQHAGRGVETSDGGLFAVDHLNRRDRVERVAGDARAGDGDLLQVGGLLLAGLGRLRFLVLGRRLGVLCQRLAGERHDHGGQQGGTEAMAGGCV